MASRWWSASMLLASLMSLYWMTSSAQPHAPLTSDLSRPHRIRSDLPPGTRAKVQVSAQVVRDALTIVADIFKLEAVQKASNILKSFSNCASLVPGIGGLVSSIISLILAFIPQDDPVLKAVKEGFAEVNRKLDSLSLQISDLATDVEWFNYISIYSQDEHHILNAWRRFTEFTEAIKLLQSEKEQQLLKHTFISYYENTGAESSMINLYRYLTVTHTSLTVNINDLLKRKLKCDVGQIGRYNLYLNSLLWKGMVVNQFYWKLIFNKTVEEAEHAQMFKNVTKNQISTIEDCLNNYEKYMKNDVIKTAKALSPQDKGTIAKEVQKILDQKYNWYSWVVLVYDKSNQKNILLYKMTKIPVGDIVVAVDYTTGATNMSMTMEQTAKEWMNEMKQEFDTCFEGKDCTLLGSLPECQFSKFFAGNGKTVYVAYGRNYMVEPKPFHEVGCYWVGYRSHTSIYYTRNLSFCSRVNCKNGKCKRLLNSNEGWCKCDDGYYGDTCEKKIGFEV